MLEKSLTLGSLIASGQDAFMDSILSFTTLIAALVSFFCHISLEGYLGLVIAVIIVKSAIEMLKESIDSILGVRADSELSKKLKEKISETEEVQGVYDLNLHNYGPSKIVGSLHIQVRNNMTAEEIHILTREIEYKVFNEFGIILTIGIYAANNEGEFGQIKQNIEEIIKNYKEILQLHGFYIDKKTSNVFFDLIIDFSSKNKEKIKDEIISKIKEKYPEYNYNVILDSDITD